MLTITDGSFQPPIIEWNCPFSIASDGGNYLDFSAAESSVDNLMKFFDSLFLKGAREKPVVKSVIEVCCTGVNGNAQLHQLEKIFNTNNCLRQS
jgi:hypothetical protein